MFLEQSSKSKKEEDDIKLFNEYYVKWKNAKQKDNPSAAIPRFYYKVNKSAPNLHSWILVNKKVEQL